MIRKIQIDGFSGIKDQTLEIPERGIKLGRESSYEDWYDFPERFGIIGTVQDIYKRLSLGQAIVESENSNNVCNIEIHLTKSGKSYKYSLGLLDGYIITESLSVDSKIIYCRFQDNPEFMVNYKMLSESDSKTFKLLASTTIAPFLNFLEIGKPVKSSILGIIIYEDLAWRSYSDFIKELMNTYGNNVYSYINQALQAYGFEEGSLRLDREKGFVNTIKGVEYPMFFDTLGSGTQQFCKIYPLLYEAKKSGNLFVSNFLDSHLHCLVSMALQKEFRDVQMITRIHNSEVLI